MAKCPNCKTENTKPQKKWKYGYFSVEAFVCTNCKTRFRDYYIGNKYNFTLKVQKGKGLVKS